MPQTPLAFLASRVIGNSEQEYHQLGWFGYSWGEIYIYIELYAAQTLLAYQSFRYRGMISQSTIRFVLNIVAEGVDIGVEWGGVILISHNEKFITTVAKKVSVSGLPYPGSVLNDFNYGYVETKR